MKAECLRLPAGATWGGVLWDVARNAVPASLSTVLLFFNNAVTLMVVGHALGTEAQAGYSVAVSMFNLTAVSLAIGLATALDTLASQAFGRNPRSGEVGELLQRSLLVCGVLSLPTMAFLVSCEPLLRAVFGPVVGRIAGHTLRLMPVYQLATVANFCVSKTLVAQSLAQIPGVACLAATVPCLLGNWLWTPRGLSGAVATITVTQLTQLAVSGVLAYRHPRSVLRDVAWPLPLTTLLQRDRLKTMLRVGFECAVGQAPLWWFFEGLLFLVSKFGAAVVDAFNIALLIVNLLFATLNGISQAASALTGASLGRNDPNLAAVYARTCTALSIACGSLNIALLLRFSHSIFWLFSTDPAVVAQLEGAKYAMVASHLCDATQTTIGGVFRGAAHQRFQGRALLLGIWGVGMPAAIFLGRTLDLRLAGVMWGEAIGLAALLLAVTIFWWRRFDWAASARAAHLPSSNAATVPDSRRAVEAPRHPAALDPLPV